MKVLKKYLYLILTGCAILAIIIVIMLKNGIDNNSITPYVPMNEETVEFLNYDKNCFWTNHYLKYEDTEYSSLVGIDVSEFQDTIDWKKVKDDGVDFAFLRIGRRGATTGLLYDDTEFENNYKGAKENNIPIGVYFFSQAINDSEIDEEVDFVLNALKGKEINLPIVFDLEEVYVSEGTPRANDMSKEEKTARALRFCTKIEENGYKAMIYTGLYWAENSYDMEALSDFPVWFAHYGVDYPGLEVPFEIWQYSNTGKVDGIDGDVDLNIMFIRKSDQSE
ncbi:MAG: glycoside hydrolase family 25 protein [Erysipelotrichaceae bacterium]|nr:glycoside hydrolase family 25 protein [Erysipelotrichaceae bacterium]